MSIADIKNRNFQSPLNFEFRIDRLTEFNFFIQKISIPSLSIGTASRPTPFVNVAQAGDHMTFGDLVIEFKIDEGMNNWYELFSWMQGISFPEKQSQYGDMIKGQLKDLDGNLPKKNTTRANGNLYAQGTLMINSSANNPLVAISFVDIHPTSLSEIVFDTTTAEIQYATCSVTFKYDYYTVEKVR